MNSNNRKSAFLGMPHGTATSRLRKMILFRLLENYEDNICFRCGNEIESIDELSIEHKLPWENIDIELFWDLDNIAFSHLECNKPHVYHGSTPKIVKTEEGLSWCFGCKSALPINNFHKHTNRWNGLQSKCIDCRKKDRN